MANSAPNAALLIVPRNPNKMYIVSLILKPLAYFGLPAYLIHRLSQTSPLVRYYVRSIFYVCSLGFCSTVGFCAALPLSLLGRRYDVNYVVARTFYAIFSRLSDIKIVVEGDEHLQMRPCVFVGNHQSMIDILYLGRYASSPLSPSQMSDLVVRVAYSQWKRG
jgi:lysophosphatidate acyltransferase